jgi:hypothetical protein
MRRALNAVAEGRFHGERLNGRPQSVAVTTNYRKPVQRIGDSRRRVGGAASPFDGGDEP